METLGMIWMEKGGDVGWPMRASCEADGDFVWERPAEGPCAPPYLASLGILGPVHVQTLAVCVVPLEKCDVV